MERMLRLRDIAALLQIGVKPARKWLERHGVRPIDLGPGRGLGLRWEANDVRNAINRSKVGTARQTEPHAGKPKARSSFFARSASKVLADLGSPDKPVQ